jgi:hypothetical protein
MISQSTVLPTFDPIEHDSCIEQKFVFNVADKDLLWEWLEFHLVRDPAFYFGPIVSLYYDTPALSLYGEVCNGNYIKTKVRLRWYQTHFPPEQQVVNCYMEVKRKYGTRRHKQRQLLAIEPEDLAGDLFSRKVILEGPYGMPELRLFVRGILVPVLIVEYERFRFIEPDSGSRISLDTHIACTRSNPAYLAGAAPVTLASGVLEVKGVIDRLPDALRPIGHHLRKSSFSKYAICCNALTTASLSRRSA